VTRRDHLPEANQKDLQTMLSYLPELWLIRTFVDEVYGLWEDQPTPAVARRRHQALQARAAYRADPDLAKALQLLAPAKFEKMIAFLRSPVGQRVRTNNHVERTNRRVRLFEKTRYKWRRRRSLVRFVVLLLNRWRVKQPPRVRPAAQPDPGSGTASRSAPQLRVFRVAAGDLGEEERAA
jgi:hypothetical protein